MNSKSEKLLPCPFCGYEAVFGTVGDSESLDFGGQFIQCTNDQCVASSALMFPLKESVERQLAERWNRRPRPVEGAAKDSDSIEIKRLEELADSLRSTADHLEIIEAVGPLYIRTVRHAEREIRRRLEAFSASAQPDAQDADLPTADDVRGILGPPPTQQSDPLAEEMADAIEWLLPLAKGYSPSGQTDQAKTTCNRWIADAEKALAAYKEKRA